MSIVATVASSTDGVCHVSDGADWHNKPVLVWKCTQLDTETLYSSHFCLKQARESTFCEAFKYLSFYF